ncbi:MAG: dodecin family protein [Gammaproteobacteria bacterium]|jgi:flavin-binding protein dodecin|nr:dodecin family protein [Gammaproteobacteria bacterium]MDH3751011.1 dodecin family protein [Gammaproteobacteria bacterium]MDH3803972.1 dodecin family protein [Gammaproteobacteria bacterium]
MSVARVTEISSDSRKDFKTAIDNAIEKANETLDQIEGAWVKDMKVTVKDGKVDQYRVTLKVTFVLR